MRKWDEYERERDDNYDVCNNDECTQECEEFRDDDDFVSVRVNISFYWYDHSIGERFSSDVRSDVPNEKRFIEIVLHNDRKHRACKEFVIYYDEDHKPTTTAIHIGTYNLDEDRYYAEHLDHYLRLRRNDMIMNYVIHDIIVKSKS